MISYLTINLHKSDNTPTKTKVYPVTIRNLFNMFSLLITYNLFKFIILIIISKIDYFMLQSLFNLIRIIFLIILGIGEIVQTVDITIE